MAFSTQKDFMEVGFMNAQLENVCGGKTGVKLKSYSSSTDTRAWSMNNKSQSNFLADLVSCRTYVQETQGGEGFQHSKDSLIEQANEKLENINRIFNENEQLKDKLNFSEERIKIIKDENKKIKGILDQDKENPLVKKIKELRNGNKISEQDANELLRIQNLLCTKDKAVSILEAENDSLRRLIEKLSKRTQMADLKLDELETSGDVKYLQNKVNELKKQLRILKELDKEHENARKDLIKSTKNSKSSKFDSDAFDLIVNERNKLRYQLTQMCGLEDKIIRLKQRAMQADQFEKELKQLRGKGDSASLQRENEELLGNLSKCCQELGELKKKLKKFDCLQRENSQLIDELKSARCKLQFMKCMEQKLIVTENKLRREQQVIQDYECQFHQLMMLIEELEGKPISGGSGVDDGHIHDLALATKATLEQIKLEINARGLLQLENESSKDDLFRLKQEYEDDMKNLKRDYESKLADVTSELDRTKSELNKSRAELAALTDELARLRDELDRLKKLKDQVAVTGELKDECAGLRDELEKLKAENSRYKSELEQEKKKNAAERAELEKRIKQCESLKDNVEEENDKYNVQRDKSKLLANQLSALETENKSLLDQLKKCQETLEKQKKNIEEQNALLASSKAELELRNKKIQELEELIKKLNKEIEELKAKLKDTTDKLANCEEKLKSLNENAKRFEEELANLKKSLSNCTEQLGLKEAELRDANNRISSLTAENKLLNDENKKSRLELAEMKKIIGEIEAERSKNKQLGTLLDTFEKKLDDVPLPVQGSDVDLQELINQLRRRLEEEEKKNNLLASELKQCKAKPITDIKKQVQAIEQNKSDSIERLQSMHEEQMKEMLKTDDIEEIRKLLNEIKECVCTEKKKSICAQSKLQRICQKIIDQGIENLTCRELTHLHSEVYKAGIRLKPELLKNCDGKQRCCKCTEFSCCLPPISKDTEKKMIARIIFLENEVEKANKILLCLKKKHSDELCAWSLNNDLTDLVTGNTVKRNRSNLIRYSQPIVLNRKCKSARSNKKRLNADIPTRE